MVAAEIEAFLRISKRMPVQSIAVPVVGFVAWLFVLTPAVLLIWVGHVANPSDDVDWLPLYWPITASLVWLVGIAGIVVLLRRTR